MSELYSDLGVGVGLRPTHYSEFLSNRPSTVSWFEVISENFIAWQNGDLDRSHRLLLDLRRDYKLMLHGVSMNLGSVDPVNMDYLRRLKELIDLVEPHIVSDHLCWTGVEGRNLHDLLPMPYTQESLQLMSEKIRRVQDVLGRRILLENPSSYLEFKMTEMSEWEFLTELSQRADCGLLLDINNIYVSSVNHGFDPLDYLQAIPFERVGQIHLAGHSVMDGYLIDTHDEPICPEVWSLFDWYTKNRGLMSTMVERDDNIPEWLELEKELSQVEQVRRHHSRAKNDRHDKKLQPGLSYETTISTR